MILLLVLGVFISSSSASPLAQNGTIIIRKCDVYLGVFVEPYGVTRPFRGRWQTTWTTPRGFDGIIYIHFDIVKPTHQIYLNTEGLIVTAVTEGSGYWTYKVHFTTIGHKTIISLATYAYANYVLSVYYKGHYTRQGDQGLITKQYVNNRWLAYTSSGTQRVFPWFTDPQLKVPFSITISHAKDYRPITNSLIKTTTAKGSTYHTFFDQTNPIPIDKIWIVVTNLQYKIFSIGTDTATFWGQQSVLDKVNFVAQYSSKVLEFFGDSEIGIFTRKNLRLVGGRLNVFVIPDLTDESYKSPGLVMLGESSMDHSKQSLEQIGLTTANIMAYQIFYTPIYQHIRVEPMKKIYEAFIAYVAAAALEKIPVRYVTSGSTEIEEYHFTENKLTETNNITNEEKLQELFMKASGLPVVEMVSHQLNTNQAKLVLIKEPCDGEISTAECVPDKVTFFNVGTAENEIIQWPDCYNKSILKSLPQAGLLIKVDVDGLFRVLYHKANWERLIVSLYRKMFSGIEQFSRAQLLADALDFAWEARLMLEEPKDSSNVSKLKNLYELEQNNTFRYSSALTLVGYLQWETDFLPLWTGLNKLRSLDRMIQRYVPGNAFQVFVQDLLNKVLTQEMYLKTTEYLHEKRGIVAECTTHFRVERFTNITKRLFMKWVEWKKSSNGVHQNYITKEAVKPVLCAAVRDGWEGKFEVWEDWYTESKRMADRQLQLDVLYALGCSTDEQFLEKFILKLPTFWVTGKMGPTFQNLASYNNVSYERAKKFLFDKIEFKDEQYMESNPIYYDELVLLAADFATDDKNFNSLNVACSFNIYKRSAVCKEALARAKRNIQWGDLNKHSILNEIHIASRKIEIYENMVHNHNATFTAAILEVARKIV